MRREHEEWDRFEGMRSELIGYCYRMIGSISRRKTRFRIRCSASGRAGISFGFRIIRPVWLADKAEA